MTKLLSTKINNCYECPYRQVTAVNYDKGLLFTLRCTLSPCHDGFEVTHTISVLEEHLGSAFYVLTGGSNCIPINCPLMDY